MLAGADAGDAAQRLLLLAGGFHTLINLGMLLFMNEESGAVVPMALFGGGCLLAVALWIWDAPDSAAPVAGRG